MTLRSLRTAAILLSIGLLVSVCLNLFAAGAWFAGRWLDRRVEAAVGTTLRAYPPSLRREVARRLFADREALRAAIGDMREARQRMLALMRAEPLDRDALSRAMADLRAATTALQAQLHEALADTVARTPAEERRAIEMHASDLDALDDHEP